MTAQIFFLVPTCVYLSIHVCSLCVRHHHHQLFWKSGTYLGFRPLDGGTMQKQRQFSHYSLNSFFLLFLSFCLLSRSPMFRIGQTNLPEEMKKIKEPLRLIKNNAITIKSWLNNLTLVGLVNGENKSNVLRLLNRPASSQWVETSGVTENA